MKKQILSLFFLFMLSTLSTHAYSLNDSLIAYWSFDDGTARDFSGHGYDGTIMNNPVPVPGVQGLALRFQGRGINTTNGDHILLPFIDFTKIPEFTISMWVNEEGWSYWHGGPYIWFGDHTNNWLGIMNHFKNIPEDTSLKTFFSVGGNWNSNIISVDFEYSNRMKWVHYTMVYRGGRLKAYINSKLIGSISQTVRITGRNAAIARVWWYDGSETCTRFTGTIDEVRIYNRALSDKEIEELYNPTEKSICNEQSFNYENFYSDNKIILNRDAQHIDSVIRLTPAYINRSSSIWYENRLNVSKGFSTDFKFRFKSGNNNYNDDGSAPGADGIAFVIQNDKPSAVGLIGGGIGYEDISNALVVEFDTYSNDVEEIISKNDPNGNHVAIVSNGIQPVSACHTTENTLAINSDILPIISDGRIYHVRIDYNMEPNTLRVYLDEDGSFITPVLSLPNFDLARIINLYEGKKAYLGITSATGQAFEVHEIMAWEVCLFDSTATDADVDEIPVAKTAEVRPNPFSNLTTINYYLEEASNVEIKIFNMLGKELMVLTNEYLEKGPHSAAWDGSDYGNGVYYFTLTAGKTNLSGKLILNK